MSTIDAVPHNECVGCALCHDVCPVGAIEMQSDGKGFLQPVIDQDACVDCGKCASRCPLLCYEVDTSIKSPLKSFAAYSKNESTRYLSTSGGAFSELAECVLKADGIVVGAAYGDEFSIVHRAVETSEDLELLRQSKYAQSDTSGIFRLVKAMLKEGKIVLFAGTPCLVSALYSYVGERGSGLITVDFLCLGVNSPWVYREYLSSLEEKYGSKVSRIWFKNKELGWNRFSTRVDFVNGRTYRKDRATDGFMRGYIVHPLYIREGCTRCRFKGMPHRSDITLGDFWGVEKVIPEIDSRDGVSVIFANSPQGCELVEAAEGSLSLWPVSFDAAVRSENRNAIAQSVVLDRRSDQFYADLKRYGFVKAIKRNASDKPVVRVKRAIKWFFNAIGIGGR